MGIINVAEPRPDIMLAEDLKNPHGRLLLAKGTKLESNHLRIVKMWGVIEADIEGVTPKDVEANVKARLGPAIFEEAEELISDGFGISPLGVLRSI